MIYKFHSKAAGDVIMLGPNGDQMLRLIGKPPEAKGIVEPGDMPGAIAALERAVAEDEAARRAAAEDAPGTDGGEAGRREPITLRQRVWPMVEMMRRAHAAGQPIVWGV